MYARTRVCVTKHDCTCGRARASTQYTRVRACVRACPPLSTREYVRAYARGACLTHPVSRGATNTVFPVPLPALLPLLVPPPAGNCELPAWSVPRPLHSTSPVLASGRYAKLVRVYIAD